MGGAQLAGSTRGWPWVRGQDHALLADGELPTVGTNPDVICCRIWYLLGWWLGCTREVHARSLRHCLTSDAVLQAWLHVMARDRPTMSHQRHKVVLVQMARLLALSHGEAELKEEHWQQMRHMEHCRQQRQRIVQVAIK